MTSAIPFVSTSSDAELVKEVYRDATAVRLLINDHDRLVSKLPASRTLWIDPGFDGYPGALPDSSWFKHMREMSGHQSMCDPAFLKKPDRRVVEPLVEEALGACLDSAPDWLTIPQVAQVDGTDRNKVNVMLAKLAGEYLTKREYGGVRVLPMIVTNQRQVKKKTARNNRVKTFAKCAVASSASAVWVVDSSLADQCGTQNFETERFPGMVALHEELLSAVPHVSIRVAGPYWGLNLVLWARGLISSPAVGVGNAYQYYLTGGRLNPGVARLALPPLRRWARADANLRDWISESLGKVDPSTAGHRDLSFLKDNFTKLTSDNGRSQVARFHRQWLDALERVAPAGRKMALYQEFTAAFAFGAALDEIPSEDGRAKKPGQPAKQFMVNCL